jgi:hypothetical protein
MKKPSKKRKNSHAVEESSGKKRKTNKTALSTVESSTTKYPYLHRFIKEKIAANEAQLQQNAHNSNANFMRLLVIQFKSAQKHADTLMQDQEIAAIFEASEPMAQALYEKRNDESHPQKILKLIAIPKISAKLIAIDPEFAKAHKEACQSL